MGQRSDVPVACPDEAETTDIRGSQERGNSLLPAKSQVPAAGEPTLNLFHPAFAPVGGRYPLASRTVASRICTVTGPAPSSRTWSCGAAPLWPVGASEGMTADHVRV